MPQTQYLHIDRFIPLISPRELQRELPVSVDCLTRVASYRNVISRIIDGTDTRRMVIVGPCSIHDPVSAIEYANRLHDLAVRVQDRLLVIMRVYFEKPRTTVGWKGFINDPELTGESNLELGLRRARQLLIEITELGLPVATELLDPIVPQYISDLVAWASIGARTTESQTHREMASGLSMPVGFKNSTEGNLDVAINAMEAARNPHQFLGINPDGETSVVVTRGNSTSHVVLRGGRNRTNYDRDTISQVTEKMAAAGFRPAILVDCSHGNSMKQHENQRAVFMDVLAGICSGQSGVLGWMLESHINSGNQSPDSKPLKYGVSITDPCMDWEMTAAMIGDAYDRLGNQ